MPTLAPVWCVNHALCDAQNVCALTKVGTASLISGDLAYKVGCPKGSLEVFLEHSLAIPRLPPALNSPVSIYTPGWREAP